ncbi:MAG TPA: endonuclease III [Burkholderiales bacterium]|nr:endonuclease III [Burkholderiales bacterium]
MDERARRVRGIIRLLRAHYPASRTALEYRSPFEILVATILAAQCTDERVNKVTPELFRKYPTPADFARADRAELEAIIRPTGFFRNKAKSIIGASEKIVSEFGGVVPATMAELLTLPGVARKTANIVLSAGYGKAEGIAVDTHARRLSQRLGLSGQSDPDKIERDLLAVVPRKDWLDFNFLLVDHGRAVCQARKPRCPECFLRRLCPSAVKFFPELRRR